MNRLRTLGVLWFLLLSAGLLAAQATPADPVSYSSVTELNQLISGLQQASQRAQEDISHLRIEKWKTDSGTKKQTQSDAESILRNLQNALPAILVDLKNSPENLELTFKTYRNIDALFDVFNSLVESTGAFGSKEEFQSLNKDLGAMEDSRKAFADRMDRLAKAKETEIGQLRSSLQEARAAIPAKKTVVDDTEPAPVKKPPARKKPAAKPKPASPPNSQGTQPPPAQPQPSQQ